MNTVSDFLRDLQDGDKPPASMPEHLKALWWAQGRLGHGADLAQDAGSQAGIGCMPLHRVEGDLGNAAHWYRRANKPVKSRESLEEEWRELVSLFWKASNRWG